MQLQNDSNSPKYSREEQTNSADIMEENEKAEAEMEDADPPLDEEDLEETGLSVEEADQVVWDSPATGSSGSEEKDILD